MPRAPVARVAPGVETPSRLSPWGSAKPDLAPIHKFGTWATAQCNRFTSTQRAFEKHGIGDLPHLSGPIHNDLVEPFLHSALLATQQSHVRRKGEPAITPGLVQGLDDALQRLHFYQLAGLQTQALNRSGLGASAPILAQELPAHSPE